MSKVQKLEFTIIVLFIVVFTMFIIELIKGMNFFGDSSLSNIGVFWGICSTILILIFLVVYIKKVIKEENKLIKLLWGLFPIVAIIFSILFIDVGVDFQSGSFCLNVLGIILEFVMVVLYNIYFLYYYGKENKMIVTLILYNFVVVYSCVTELTISYIHNYYMGYLVPAIEIGYIELMIRKKIKKLL